MPNTNLRPDARLVEGASCNSRDLKFRTDIQRLETIFLSMEKKIYLTLLKFGKYFFICVVAEISISIRLKMAFIWKLLVGFGYGLKVLGKIKKWMKYLFYFLYHFSMANSRKMGLVQLVRKFEVVSGSHIFFKNRWRRSSLFIANIQT